MKVRELIKVLCKCDEDTDVCFNIQVIGTIESTGTDFIYPAFGDITNYEFGDGVVYLTNE